MTAQPDSDYDVVPYETPRRRVTVDELRTHRSEIYRIAHKRRVRDVCVFGSVARNEADEDSDLDLLVEMEPDGDLFDLSGFAIDVQQLLHVFTQVTTSNGLKPRIRSEVLAEAIRL